MSSSNNDFSKKEHTMPPSCQETPKVSDYEKSSLPQTEQVNEVSFFNQGASSQSCEKGSRKRKALTVSDKVPEENQSVYIVASKSCISPDVNLPVKHSEKSNTQHPSSIVTEYPPGYPWGMDDDSDNQYSPNTWMRWAHFNPWEDELSPPSDYTPFEDEVFYEESTPPSPSV